MTTKTVEALVVGAGIAGLYQLYKLREAGMQVHCVDAGSDIGGTWHWNCYPGARLDSPSYTYQYWFSDELLDQWRWSERFPTQPEIKRYLKFTADKFALHDQIQLNTRIVGADWDDSAGHWVVRSEAGEVWHAQYLVSCVGMLSAPKLPPFPGHEKFKGTIAHTARWPQGGVDLKGKKVGVVGTGATGIQVIQTIAAEVDELNVFQRTAQYAVKMDNYSLQGERGEYWRSQHEHLKNNLPNTFGGFEWTLPEMDWARSLSVEERHELLESCWADGSLKMWVGTYPEVLTDAALNQEVSEFAREKIRARINNPALEEKLVPTSYGFGTYRVPLENGYYEVFSRDNVNLVDVAETPIESFSENGLIVGGKEYELDVLVLATGFDAGTGSLTQMNIRGRDGVSLTELWSRDITSTMGLQVHGFPNLFTIAGPLAPATAFCNMPTCLQQQVDWVSDAIFHLRDNGFKSIEPSQAKQDEWVSHHDEVANMTLLVHTNAWYNGANIEGKPRRLLSYIGGVGTYRDLCAEVAASGYQGFIKAA